jgi:predicted acetyltransferase
MDIKIVVNNHPSKAQLRKYQEFSDKHWGKHNHSKEERKNFFDVPKIVVLAYFKTQLVGLLNIHIRNVHSGNKSFSLGGIGGVVVNKKTRRKRIATKLLKQAMKEMREMKIDVSMLCTNVNKLGDLYKKVGFTPLQKPYYFYDLNKKQQKEMGGMIAPVSSKKNSNMLLNSKEKINVGLSNF